MLIHTVPDDPSRFWGVLPRSYSSTRHSLNLVCNMYLHSCSSCCGLSLHNEMIFSSEFSLQHSSQAINSRFGYHKLYLGNLRTKQDFVITRSFETEAARAVEARAYPGSKKKSFVLVAPDFCWVAKLSEVSQVMQQDVNSPRLIGVLGGYRIRRSFILNMAAVLVCTEPLAG